MSVITYISRLITFAAIISSLFITACSTVGDEEDEPDTNAWMTIPVISEGSSGQRSYNLAFYLGKALDEDITIQYTVQDITATSDEDFEFSSGKVTFPRGIRMISIPIIIYGDIVEEEDETIRINLSAPKNIKLREKTYIVKIPNDDDLPIVSLTRNATVQELDTNRDYSVRVGLSYPYSEPISVTFQANPLSASEDDFTLVNESVVIPANTRTFDAPILLVTGDLQSEEDESFSVQIVSSDKATIADDSQSTITIVDNDPLPEITFATFTDEVTESAGSVDVMIELDRPSSRIITADIELGGTAQRNTDYRLNQSLSLTLQPEETQYPLTIFILSDSVREGGETITLDLNNVVAADLGNHPKYSLLITSEVSINDTGVTLFSDTSIFDYAEPVVGFEGQDGDHGSDTVHDTEPFIVLGEGINPQYNGRSSFDFTKLDASGNPLSTSDTQWACIRDNNTGLIFERKNEHEYFEPVSENSESSYLLSGNYRAKNFSYTWQNKNNANNGGFPGWFLGKNGGPLPTSAPTLPPNCGFQENLFGRSHKLYCSTDSYVDELNYKGLCGYKDWRLPNTEELRSIVNYAKHETQLFTHPFDEGFFDCLSSSETVQDCVTNGQEDEYYWTGTPAANNPDSAWCFNVTTAEFRLCHKSETHRIISVRSDY